MMLHTKSTASLILGVSLSALLSVSAFAQDEQNGTRSTFLGVINVTGGENPTAPLESSVAKTAATSKTSRTILETQSSVSVVPRAQIDAIGATNLASALRYSAGVITENYGGDPRFDSLYLRGFNLENDKFLDGLRLMRSTQFPTSAPSFELYGLERVEILRGPASVLYGAGTPAGLVNSIQKRAQADGDFSEVGVGFDTNSSLSTFGDVNRVVNEDFAYRLTGKVSNERTDVHEIDNKRLYLGLSASYALGDATELEFMGSLHKDKPMTPTGVPDSFVGVYNDKELRDFYFGDDSVDDSDRTMGTLSAGITHEFENNWKLNGTFRYTNHDWTYHSMYLDPATGSSVGRGIITQDESFSALAADVRLSGTVDTGDVTHNLVFGLDAQKLREKAYTGFSYSSAIDYLSPTYGGLSIAAPWYTANKNVDATQVGLYALDELALGNWRATLGLRQEWTDQSGANVTNFGGTTNFDRRDHQATGHAGLGYVWDSGVATYVSYSTSYLPQPGVDIENVALKPTHGKQWEAGVKYEPTAFDGLFSAALYDLRETDRNTTVFEDIGGSTISGIRQIGEAQVRGLELEAAAEIADGWTVKSAYTYSTTEILAGLNSGNELANTPRHAASVWLSHTFASGTLEGLTLGAGVRHIGTRYSSDANTLKLDAVTLLDLGASYKWDNGLVGRLNISNVTDEAYISAIGLNSAYFGNGRNIQASLTYKW
jgi:iron complex outermembrane receptor protein